MGRIFEVRKSSMFARWDKMARTLPVLKRDCDRCKAADLDPNSNAALRRCFQMREVSECQRTEWKPPLKEHRVGIGQL